jgi:hypothetical protein
MRLAVIIAGTAALGVVLLPNLSWEQAIFNDPPVKLADLDKATVAMWQAFPAFPIAKDFHLIPKSMGNDGLAQLNFTVTSDDGSPRGSATLTLLPSVNAVTHSLTIWMEAMSMDQALTTTFIPSPAGDNAICLMTSSRITHQNYLVCDVAQRTKVFTLGILAPTPAPASLITEVREAAEAGAGFADGFTTAPPAATAADNPDPAVAAIVTPPLSNRDMQDSGAVGLVTMDPKTRAAFDRVKTYTFKWDYSDGDYRITGQPVSASPDIAEYTRRFSGTGIDPSSTVEFELFDNDLDAIISAQAWNTPWLPAGHGDAPIFSNSTGGEGKEGDFRCVVTPLPNIKRVVTRCFTNNNNAVAGITVVTDAANKGDNQSRVTLAAALATAAAKDFQQTMNDLSK